MAIYEKVTGARIDVSTNYKIVCEKAWIGVVSIAPNAIQRCTVQLSDKFADVDKIIDACLAICDEDAINDSIYVVSQITDTFNKQNKTVDIVVRNVYHDRKDSNNIYARITGIKFMGGINNG